MRARIDAVLNPDAQPPSPYSCVNFTAARMLLILFSVFAMLVQNGNSNCMLDFQSDMQECNKAFTDRVTEASKMNTGKERDQKTCCGFREYESCITDAGKKCGDGVSQLMKQAIDGMKSSVTADCSSISCSGAESIVPVNSMAMYLLLFLGYFLYVNKF